MHGEQKFAYERPVVPGDVLTATLTVASLRQIGGNDIIGTSSEITDEQRRARLRDQRHPRAPGGGRRRERPRAAALHRTRADLVRYAGASGDFNPIHRTRTSPAASGCPA